MSYMEKVFAIERHYADTSAQLDLLQASIWSSRKSPMPNHTKLDQVQLRLNSYRQRLEDELRAFLLT